MRILVTGGAGYIGSTLVPALLNAGYAVTVLDNYCYNQLSLLDYVRNPNLKVVVGDARDGQLLKRELPHVDVIIPLAAVVGAPASLGDKVGTLSLNYTAIETLDLLRSPSQVVLYPTTNSGYGIGQNGQVCTEETPLHPISLYAETKARSERLLLESGNVVTLRLATVFGLSQRMRLDLLVNDFTYRACTDGYIVLFESNFKRNFIHVSDVSRAYLHVLHNYATMHDNVYNVGLSSANLSKLELCEMIKQQVPKFHIVTNDFTHDPDQRNYIVSNEKIEKTGFHPQVDLATGIAELIRGYRILRNNRFTNL
jgi:nucleoside-diphosphate-sugar epimerase